MLERTVEQLLLQFLDPYVEGISRDKLHFGVFSGSLELKDLKVRPDALTSMGMEGFRVRNGSIRLIRLLMPLSNMYHGKVEIIIDGLSIEVEQTMDVSADRSEQDLLKEIRHGKRKAIDTRMIQLRELVEEKAVTATEKTNFRIRLLRKIVNNFRIQIKDVQVSISSTRGLACGFELPMLALMSTDRTFRELAANEQVVLEGKSMYKLVQLQKLGFRMSLVGNCSLEGAEYVVSPISASLQVAHELDNPSDQVLRLRLEVATEELAELTIRRSQVKHLRGILAASSAESERLHDLMVSPAEEKSILEDTNKTKAEYSRLYERHLMHEWKLSGEDEEALSEEDMKRIELLEDAFSVRLLAKQRWIVRSKVEALNEEVTRRQVEAEQEVERSKGKLSFFRRLTTRWGGSELSDPAETTMVIDKEEREQLMRDMNDNSKVEEVDVPQSFKFELLLGQMQVELIDDRWTDAHKQLLHLSLRDAEWKIGVHMTHDYRGQDSAEWQVECHLSSFQAHHTHQPVFSFTPHGYHNSGFLDEESPHVHQAGLQETTAAVHGETLQYAARWLLKNELRDTCNLLIIKFEFEPLRLYWAPGGVEQFLDFIRAPEDAYANQATPVAVPRSLTMLDHDLRQEEIVDVMKNFMQTHGSRAKEVADQVYDRIPDKIQLDLKFASPIITVPVDDLGSAEFSLGELTLHTTEPAELYKWDLALDLNHTALRAQSSRGERFDMIHPVPVHLDITYIGSDDEHSITVCMQVEDMTLSLSPQALSILLSTPMAVANILYPNYGEGATGSTAAPSTSSEPSEHSKKSLSERASAIAEQVGLSENLEAAVRTVTEVRRKFFRCNFAMQINAINLTLADSIVPVMRLNGSMTPPGFVLYYQNMPFLMTIDIEDGVLEWDTLNQRNGAWEPLGERFHLGLHMERKAHGEDGRFTTVTVSGHQPLLLNLTPSAVKQAAWVLPQFYKAITFEPLDEDLESTNKGGVTARTGVKYRVISLYDQPIELEFRSSHQHGLITRIGPTGSTWQPLDKWVLPYFSTALVARLPRSNRCSELLSLERPGAVAIPGTGVVAEILSPSPSHRLLLLASTLRMHNQTDMRLTVRFHIAQNERTVLPLQLDDTSACDASLLGHAAPLCASFHEESEVLQEDHSLILPPNHICSVPEAALVRAGGARISNSHAWISVRPSAINAQFCNEAEVGVGVEAFTVVCRSKDRGSGFVHRHPNDMHFVYDCRWYDSNGVHYDSAEIDRSSEDDVYSPFKLTTVAVRPTLCLLNGLPIGNLTVGYASANGPQTPEEMENMHFMEAQVQCFSRLNLYNFPGVLREGICVRAKLDPSCDWSAPIHFTREAFRESDSKKMLDLYQQKDGAAAGVVVEPVSRCEMRFSCPFWFVDRSGLENPHKVQLRYRRRRLPHYKALSLFPANCLEERCQLLLKLPQETNVHDVLFPPNFAILALKTSSGPFVFCLQTEDVNASDVLGAQCQVVTLRPRLVLTNSSEHELEMKFIQGQVQSLKPGESIEWHWTVEEDDLDSPKTSMLFRPRRRPPCQWSGTVVCSDAAAGSSAFLLPVSDKRHKRDDSLISEGLSAEVWTAEIAPVRGALAVSFRVGSDFIAANRARRANVEMAIRPFDCPDSLADITVPAGEEVPYGWAKPFRSGPDHCSITVVINSMRFKISDVRKTTRYPIPREQVAIVITKYGTQTKLSVVDWRSRDAHTSEMTSGGSCYQVDLKVSHLGVSLVEESPTPRELLFMYFELVRFRWTKDSNGTQQLFLAISDAQVNCQLPGRTDGATMDVRRHESLGLLKQTVPAVILANCAEGDRAFLHLALTRGATSSRDLLLPSAEVSVDAMDVTVDDGWLDPLARFMSDAKFSKTERGLSFRHISQTAGKSIIHGYSPPPLPYVVQIESMRISAINLTAFCSLKLSSRVVKFLPQHVRTALRVLSFSQQLKLDGAMLVLPERELKPHRGSMSDFIWGLKNEYTMNLISNAASALGKSSVMNLPRAPIKLGGTAISYLSDSLGLMAGEAASVVNTLTFDDDYVLKQREIRENKRITGLGDGVVEAGNSLAQGLEGMMDVVTKPIEGAKEDGFKGFTAGVGKGLIGTFVKPFAGLGQAMQDMGTGIASAVTPDTAQMKRRRNRVRTRHPRLMFTELGVLRPWVDLEAEVLNQLGTELTRGAIEVVPLTQGQHCRVLLLFAQRMVIVDVVRGSKDPASSKGAPRRSTAATSTSSSSSSSGGVPPQRLATAGEDSASPDFLGAIDESAMKLFSQALKPFNTLVYGAQDIESMYLKQPEAGPETDSESARNSNEYRFVDLREVRWRDGPHHVLELVPRRGDKPIFQLPLGAAPINDAIRNALFNGFNSTLSQTGHAASWEELRVAMAAEQRTQAEEHCYEETSTTMVRTGAGQRELEVFEVQRWSPLPDGKWRTPWLPQLDRESCYKWVDASMHRHPHLDMQMTKEQIAEKTKPPCKLDEMFKPISGWEVDDCSTPTDEKGWRYALAWNSSTWDSKPGLFNSVRKRRWTRIYA